MSATGDRGAAATRPASRDDVARIRFHVPMAADVDGFLADARAIVESGWLSGGDYVRRLESAAAPWVGRERVVAATSATGGLIAALVALGEPGAEAIIPGYTFIATWGAVRWAGMVPVVADVDERGLLDVDAVAAAITPRTRAIVPVPMAGQPAPMAALLRLAERAGARVVADAAHAFGSRHADRPVGADGDAQVFSIGATKPLGADEGALIAVRDADVEARVRRFGFHGGGPGIPDAIELGLNLRMPELTAALALRNLARFEAHLARREAIHRRYAAAWAGLPLRLSGPRPGERSCHKDQLVWLDDASARAPLREFLLARGIETRPYYATAVPDLTAFDGIVASADSSRALAARSFAVPIHGRLADGDVERVSDGLRAFFR